MAAVVAVDRLRANRRMIQSLRGSGHGFLFQKHLEDGPHVLGLFRVDLQDTGILLHGVIAEDRLAAVSESPKGAGVEV